MLFYRKRNPYSSPSSSHGGICNCWQFMKMLIILLLVCSVTVMGFITVWLSNQVKDLQQQLNEGMSTTHHDNEAYLQNLTCVKQNLCFELSCSLISTGGTTEVTEFEFVYRYDSSNSSIVHYIQFCIYWKIRLQNDQIKFFLINLMPLNAEFLTFDIHGS